MALLSRLWQWLTSQGHQQRVHYFGSSETPIDVDQVAANLRLHETARSLGQSNLPDWSGGALSGAELRIVQEVEKALSAYTDHRSNRLKIINEAINACDISAITNRGVQIGEEFGNNASALIGNWERELSRLHATMVARRKEFDAFRADNRISREPSYPVGGKSALLVAILITLIVLEGMANAYYFARGLWGGLLSGFTYAALLSLLNVIVAWAFGRFALPQVHHVALPRKVIGIIFMGLYVLVAIALAIAIGHYRDALGQSAIDAPKLALQSLLAHPFGLQDVNSWFLAAISIVFSVMALADSYHMEDPYPGYGSHHRRLRESEDEFEEQERSLKDELEILRNASLSQLDSLFDKATSDLKALEKSIDQKSAERLAYQEDIKHCQSACIALIGMFRDENLRVRPPGSALPSDFPPVPTLGGADLDFDLGSDRRKARSQKALHERLKTRIEDIRAGVQRSFTEQIEQSKTIQEVINRQA